MKLVAWAIAVLGVWILVGGIMPALNWVSIVCGVAIAVLAIIGAVKG